jgi:acetyl esterase/lipase
VLHFGYEGATPELWTGSDMMDCFSGAIPVAAPIPRGTDVDWEIPVYVIHSKQDPIVPYGQAESPANALEAAGNPVKWAPVSGLTHYDANSYGSYLSAGTQWIRQQP